MTFILSSLVCKPVNDFKVWSGFSLTWDVILPVLVVPLPLYEYNNGPEP